MRGILVVVERDWLELVERESRASFALGRLDRSQPAWTEPGDPWLLACGDPPPSSRAPASSSTSSSRSRRRSTATATAPARSRSSTRSRSSRAASQRLRRPGRAVRLGRARRPHVDRPAVRRARARRHRRRARPPSASRCASTTPRSRRCSAPRGRLPWRADRPATARTVLAAPCGRRCCSQAPPSSAGIAAAQGQLGRRRGRVDRAGHGLDTTCRSRRATTRPATTTPARPRRPRRAGRPVSIEWVGDMVLGSSFGMPPDDGRGRWPPSSRTLRRADLTFGNLEETMSTTSGSKCGAGSSNCYAFQAPPSYSGLLRSAGFDVMNMANNHAFDFGSTGRAQTVAALTRVQLASTGAPGQITVLEANGTRVAFLGFAPYPVGCPARQDPAGRRARAQGGDDGRSRRRRDPRRRRGLVRDARAAGHRVLPRREPRQLARVRARGRQRGRRPRRRLRDRTSCAASSSTTAA